MDVTEVFYLLNVTLTNVFREVLYSQKNAPLGHSIPLSPFPAWVTKPDDER